MASIYSWSTTANSNSNSDVGINWAEGQLPGTVNGSARAMMGRIAEILGDLGGALAAGGTANALTVTANSAFAAYADGLALALRITTDNTTAATLNVNAIGAKSIRKMVAAGDSALTGAELQADGIYLFRYSAALNAAAGGWLLLNPSIDVPNLVTLTGTQILTNKTLTSPTINTPTIATPAMTNGTSSGMAITTATITQPVLTLKQSTTPTPTAEGDIQWDTDDNVLAIGDGAATQLFLPIPASTAAGDIEYYTAAKVTARLAKGSAGQTLRMNSAGTAPEWGGANGTPDAVLEDQKTSGTDGGAFTSGAWRTRDLNTEVRDASSLISIASNQFTPTVAGWVEWSAPALKVNLHKTRLFNVTDSTVAGVGVAATSGSGEFVTSASVGGCAVVAGKTYRVEHQCSTTYVSGFGASSGFTTTAEVYTRVLFWRT